MNKIKKTKKIKRIYVSCISNHYIIKLYYKLHQPKRKMRQKRNYV